ncbi:MAG: hypothetical protein SFX19_03755 [Alphaproteobacteria bacterium]|nr:hypothetical protein [Alphaproteobacteria bacterium]
MASLQEILTPLQSQRILPEYASRAEGSLQVLFPYSDSVIPDVQWDDQFYQWEGDDYLWRIYKDGAYHSLGRKGSGAYYHPLDNNYQEPYLAQLAARRAEFEPTLFFGVAGGVITLDSVANGRFSGAILAGIDPYQRNLWRSIIECVAESDGDRHRVPELLLRYNQPNYLNDGYFTGYDPELFAAEMRKDLKRPSSWLGSDENFQHIYRLVQEGNIVPIIADAVDMKRYMSMRNLLQAGEAPPIGLIYGSNVALIIGDKVDYIRAREYRDNSQEIYFTNLAILSGNPEVPMADGKENPKIYLGGDMALEELNILPLSQARDLMVPPPAAVTTTTPVPSLREWGDLPAQQAFASGHIGRLQAIADNTEQSAAEAAAYARLLIAVHNNDNEEAGRIMQQQGWRADSVTTLSSHHWPLLAQSCDGNGGVTAVFNDRLFLWLADREPAAVVALELPESEGGGSLLHATLKGPPNPSMIKELLERGVDPYRRDRGHQTYLDKLQAYHREHPHIPNATSAIDIEANARLLKRESIIAMVQQFMAEHPETEYTARHEQNWVSRTDPMSGPERLPPLP